MRFSLFLLVIGCTADVTRPLDGTPDSDTGDRPLQDAHLRMGEVRICSDPGARAEQPFHRYEAWEATQNHANNHIGVITGGGVAAGDLDGDGVPDLFLTGKDDSHLYLSEDGGWVNRDDRLPDGLGNTTVSATLVDLDGDENLDLFVGRYKRTNQVLLNDGTGHFTLEDAGSLGLDAGAWRTVGSAWADFDADGDLDVFLTNYGQPDHPPDPAFLFRRTEDGFESIQGLPETLTDAHTFVAGWHDLDDDGWLDLYGVNDFGWDASNPLLWNQGDGTLAPDDGSAGLDFRSNGMGLGVGDLNADGLPDVVVPAWEKISVGISAGERRWYQKQSSLGIFTDPDSDKRHVSWAAEVADLDNDGDEDVLVAFGHIKAEPDQPLRQPDAVFVQGEDGEFTEVSAAWGLDDDDRGRGMVVADLDDDGWLDVLKASKSGPARLYLSRCGEAAWLRVQLRDDTNQNRFGLGAKITVQAGERTWWRRIGAGSTSLASGGPPEAHFGLGAAEHIDEIVVDWPDRTRSVFTDLTPRRVVTIERL